MEQTETIPQEVKVETAVETPVVEISTESVEQINWKKFREQKEADRKSREAAEKRASEKEAEAHALKAAMEAILNKPSQQTQQYQEDESEDDRINKKVEAALSIREKKLDEERRKQEQAQVPQKLVTAYKDFDKVCSAENLDYLEFHYPEVAIGFKHMPDGFDKWAAVYQAVKRFMPNTDIKKDQKTMEKNNAKPQSMNVPGSTSTGDGAPVQLDDKRRADNWSRMQKVMRGG